MPHGAVLRVNENVVQARQHKGSGAELGAAVAQGSGKAALHAGRVIACTAIALFTQPERLAQAKAEFDQAAEGGYVCPIPPDAVPVVAD